MVWDGVLQYSGPEPESHYAAHLLDMEHKNKSYEALSFLIGNLGHPQIRKS